jgi:predicted transcriptional regulator
VTELAILLPLLAFVALAAGVAVVLRRAGRIVATTREVDGFRRDVRDLAARVETSLEGATTRVDAVRRGQVGAETIAPVLEAAQDAVSRYTDEARALRPRRETQDIRDAIVGELERAARALDMIEHASGILVQARRRGRELEANTSLKRGYLNLLHAREAIARHALRVDDIEVSVPSGGREPVVSLREPRP